MWDTKRSFERSDRAIAEGQLWRAKEILGGSLSIPGLHTELYERYGQLLIRMGDLVKAGKYLYLSGARLPEYEESIQLFLDRHHRDPQGIFHAFPSQARLVPWEEFPSMIRRETEGMGFTWKPWILPRAHSPNT